MHLRKTVMSKSVQHSLARIGQMIVGSVVCIWIAEITPIATSASAFETTKPVAVLAYDLNANDTPQPACRRLRVAIGGVGIALFWNC
jgi:hypothetical protein